PRRFVYGFLFDHFMEEHVLISLAGILVIGTGAQWLAMRLKLPSILFLLIFGFLAGPVIHLIHPDELFGHSLFPIISLSVAIILFEGGMDLKLDELRDIGTIVRNLISIGVLATWIFITAAAYFILHLELSLAVLFGAILVVTGPTVIGPLLRHVRPTGRVGSIVKWEGIMNDPIGVLIAVLVFESIIVGNIQEAGALIIAGVLKTIFFSAVVGVVSAFLLIFLLKRYWIPDALHQVVTLMFIFLTFVISNYFQVESGLLAVTLMGVVMANQKQVSVQHILEFKENLRVLIISILFILLAARLKLSDFQDLNSNSLIFLAVLIFVIRPASIMLSAIGTNLKWKEILFISWMAPRGIVAAAMASIFAYQLQKSGFSQANALVPLVFMVIVATVGLYGLTITPLAHILGLAKKNPQGILMVGGQNWARMLAKKFMAIGIKVIIVDSNKANVRQARKEGIKAYYENVLHENIDEKIDLDDIGRLMCLTSNDEANALAALRFQDIFGSEHVYQLFPEETEGEKAEEYTPKHLRGRYLFRKGLDYPTLTKKFVAKAKIQEVKVTDDFNFDEIKRQNPQIDPVFLLDKNNILSFFAADDVPHPEPGQRLFVLS
ncbi:MAG: sodium:proton antiporter, partial [Candidatus Omnitrophica bacterium]|nr:sodium:proton antiporter [Candidatus Omnitrophota bacterium]